MARIKNITRRNVRVGRTGGGSKRQKQDTLLSASSWAATATVKHGAQPSAAQQRPTPRKGAGKSTQAITVESSSTPLPPKVYWNPKGGGSRPSYAL